MLPLKNRSAYYITIKANRDSEIKTLFAGESFGEGGFFVDFDRAKRFNCPLSAEKWLKFNFDETNLPPDYYDWASITIEELKLVPVEKINLSKEGQTTESVKEDKPKRIYNKKKRTEIPVAPII